MDYYWICLIIIVVGLCGFLIIRYRRGCAENRHINDHFCDQIMTHLDGSDRDYLAFMQKRFVNNESHCSKTHDHLEELATVVDQKLQRVENKRGSCWFDRGDLKCIEPNGEVVMI